MKNIFFILMLLSVYSVAQKTVLIKSGSLIKEGIKFHDNNKFEEALEKFNLVDRNDTNYSWAMVEKAITYNALKQYDKTIKTCLEALHYSSENTANIYNSLGTAYDELGQSENAIEAYKKGTKYAPYFHLLYFNIALTYSRLEKYDSSIIYAKKAIDCNIYHASSHYLLGNIYYRRQLNAQAMLSFQMFLLMEPTSGRSSNALDMLIATCQINEVKSALDFTISPEDNIFETLNIIIKSKIALNEKYKTPIKKIKDPLINQMYVMIEKLETSTDISNFWHRNYTKFFKDIFKEDYFLPHTYFILSNIQIRKIQKELKKKKSKIDAYIKWAGTNLDNIRNKRYIFYKGKYQTVSTWYEKDNSLASIGELKDANAKKPVYMGHWEFYYKNGSTDITGEFSNDGKIIGKWNYYYPSGALKDERLYKDNEIYEMKRFYEDGVNKTYSVRTGETKDYNLKYYYNTGQINSEENYINDKKNGKAVYYYPTGEKLSESTYKDDEETAYTEFYVSGIIKSQMISKGDKSYEVIGSYENGKNSYYGNIFERKRVGKWKWFYEDEVTKKIENYDNEGNLQDSTYEYNTDGKLSETVFFSKGKKNNAVVGYDHDGKLHYEIIYKNDEPVSYKFFDKNKNVISSSELKKGTLEYKSTYPTGETDAVGVFKDGKREGTWKYYHRIGTVRKEENYSKNKLNGNTKVFFNNGLILSEYYMKEDKAEGYYKKYFANGNIEKEGWYVNDKAEGYWFTYNANGTTESIDYYLHDILTGYQQEFRIDGTMAYERYFSEDLERKYIFFDTAGIAIDTSFLKSGNGTIKKYGNKKQLIREYNFVSGLISGTLKSYHYNGKLYETTEYLRGKQNGTVNYYDYKGNIILDGKYEDGSREGEWKWYKNTKLKSSGKYKNGKQNGIWKYFSENGKLVETEDYNVEGEMILKSIFVESGELVITKKYDHGMLFAYTYYDKTNKYVPDISIKNETGIVIAYFSNGKKSIEQEYKSGSLSGTSIRYYPNGNPFMETPIKYFGEIEGIKKTYWPDGKIKSEEPYFFNEKNGECKYYRQDGTLEHSEMYYVGLQHGTNKYYDNKGTIIHQEKYQYDLFYE